MCAWCGNRIYIGNIIFWRPEGGRKEGQDDVPLHPPCAEKYREHWWAGVKKVRATDVLEDYASKSRDVWKQEELDSKALRWGIEERKKLFFGGGLPPPLIGDKPTDT